MTRIATHPLAHARAADPRSPRALRRPYPGAEALLALLAASTVPMIACVIVPGDEEPATSSTTEAATDDTASPDTGTTVDPGATEDSSATANTDDSDTDDSDTDDSDTDEPTTGEPADGCLEPSEADASFLLELEGWPAAESSEYEIAAACTVLDVQTDGDTLVTTLECDDAGELRPATMRIAATSEGAPSWGPASEVALAYSHLDDTKLRSGTYRSLSLRRADDQALLVAATSGDGLPGGKWIGGNPGEYLAPVVGTEDREYCGWTPGYDGELPMRIILELEGESLELVNQQRGVLPIPGQTDRLAVDLGEASVGHCCHYTSWVHLLVRRVS